MNFTLKGLERKREGAKEEVQQLLEELKANSDENNDEKDPRDDELTPQPSKKKGEKKQAVADDSHVAKGKLLAKGLEFGNRSSVTVAGLIFVDLQLGTKIEPADNKLEVMDTETAETTECDTKTTHPLSNKIKTTRKKKNLWFLLAQLRIPRFRHHSTRSWSRRRRHEILWCHITRNF